MFDITSLSGKRNVIGIRTLLRMSKGNANPNMAPFSLSKSRRILK